MLTLSRDAPCDGVMYVVACIRTTSAANAAGFNLVDVVDNNGNHFAAANGANAGFAGVDQRLFVGPNFASRLFITQTFVRVYVPTDYHTGDTLTLTFNFPDPANLDTVAMAFPLIDVLNQADPQQNPPNPNYVVEIGNGDQYPDLSADPQVLNWQADLGTDPNPQDACRAITASAASPGGGSPAFAEGSTIGAVSGLGFDLIVGLTLNVGATQNFEPGVGWGANQTAIVGNYQFIKLV